MTQRFPLTWPAGRPRTPDLRRKPGAFKAAGGRINIDGAFQRVGYELDRIGGKNPLVSTNLELRVDGRPRMDRAAPSDPGVCLYFDLAGKPHALACDAYQSVPQNLAAIAAHLEATRAIARHGVATTAEMFTAFQALPAPRTCWEVLGLDRAGLVLTSALIMDAYKSLAKSAHPDRGGSHAAMAELNAARDEALRQIR